MKTDQPRWEGARWWLHAWLRGSGAQASTHAPSHACYVLDKNKGPASLQALVFYGAAPGVETVFNYLIYRFLLACNDLFISKTIPAPGAF